MKTILSKLWLGLALILPACSQDHVYYETAPNTSITGLNDEYEAGEAITFSCDVVPTNGASIVSYLWEFGDPNNSTSTEASPTFTYTSDGTFTVKLSVVDSNNLKTTKTRNVVIINPTKADFTVDKDEYLVGDVVKFYDNSTTKGTTTVTGWLWEFGDPNQSTSTEQNPQFEYAEAGSYPVKLTVTDSYGLKATVTKSVNIIDPSMIIQVQWTAIMGGAVKGGSSPAMSPDGNMLYMLCSKAGDDPAVLKAFNAENGQIIWTADLSTAMQGLSATAAATDVFGSPAVGADGSIYALVRDLQSTSADRVGPVMMSINTSGKTNWAKACGVGGTNMYAITPAIGADGYIYVANRSQGIYQFDAQGNVKEFAHESSYGNVTGGFSISKSGMLYGRFNGLNGTFAFNTTSGNVSWVYNTDYKAAPDAMTGALPSALVSIGEDGTLYTVSDGGTGGMVISLNPSGSANWVFNTQGAIPDGGVVLGSDGSVYANGGTSTTEGIIALNSDGSKKWTFATKAKVQTSPVIDNRGYIHVVDASANYYVVDNNGDLYSEASLGESCVSSPVMDSKGRLYVAVTKDGVVTMICVTSRAESYNLESAWPMRGQNPCRTGLQK